MVEIDHVVIHVSDWDRSREFYGSVVGAEIVDHPDGHYALRFGRQQLNLHGPGLDTKLVAKVPVAPGNTDICFRWDGAPEEAIAHLEAKDVAVEVGPVARNGVDGQGVSVYFRDPDGSLLEFISYQRAPSEAEIAAGLEIQQPLDFEASTGAGR